MDEDHSQRQDICSLRIANEIVLALQTGKCELQGQFVRGSNYTFLVKVSIKNLELTAVYKPIRCEQPFCDFPTNSLANR
jgi:hypothetical protein